MTMTFKNRLLATSLLVGAGVLGTPAQAQNLPPAPPTTSQNDDSAAQNPPAVTTQADPQIQADQAEGTSTNEIVVTGTLIRNPNLTSASPVSVVNESEITLRTPNNAEELIRRIPGVSAGIGTQVNNGSNGTSSVDLRGLGTQRNLVLLDGNRIVPTLANGAVDLNLIPIALLSRVDVLTGGASTTYGADAVSGVVNFITRRDFSGVDVRASYKLTEEGDGQAYRTDVTFGGNFDDNRGNAVLSFGYTNAKPVYQIRPFALFGVNSNTGAASGSSFTSVPTTISFPGVVGVVGPQDLQFNTGATALVPQYQGFNFNPYNIFQTPLERKSAYGSANYEVADGIELYARGLFASSFVQSVIAPSGVFGNALVVNANNPYLTPAVRDQICAANGIALGTACTSRTGNTVTTGLPLPGVYRRLVELGPRLGSYQNNVYDARVGARFDVTASTNLDINAAYGRAEQTLTNSGYVLNSRVQQALIATSPTACTVTTGGCVPLNLFGTAGSITPDQVAFIQGSSSVRINNQLTQVRAIYSGDFGMTAPWATQPISFALGGEYRRYDYERIPDARAQDPSELGGAGGAVLPFSGGYNVKEGFAELIAPIVADRPFFDVLQLETGVRYSSYSINTTGSNPTFDAWTYKGALTWQPTPGLRFRGNYQRAVRAPNIAELFSPSSVQLTNLAVDPCAGAAPLTNANLAAVCLAQGAPAGSIGAIQQPSAGQANALFQYSSLLKPEKADTYTVGVVITPKTYISGLTASVDYYNIKINDAITFATPGDAISACFGGLSATSATSPACTIIRRNPANGRLSGPSATTQGLFLPETNLGRLATDGVDFTLNYVRDLGIFGFNYNLSGNWTRNLKFRASPNSVNRECVGYYSANCGPSLGQIQPELSWQQRTTFSYGPASLSLLWRHLSSVKYEPGLPPLFNGTVTGSGALVGESFNFNRISAYNYFDLNAQFDVLKNFQLTLGVQNLLDKDPPIVGGQAGTTTANSGNTFPSTYDPLGRAYSAAVRVKF
ncbi:TonB-dependent receptor [Sphingomonas sp. BN140010]|uniref:TonB-dependent receptor n=1 Tax=Sphingomonas arvum TaxID=2992113 RepID=A0ABT3JGA4_9SPHN|nr:TonB-dependent receptor [Sphingomonas sp. BN140010]MCW3797959.1 TonB-dependent receptor [Sphingomonas sp. BN140010]